MDWMWNLGAAIVISVIVFGLVLLLIVRPGGATAASREKIGCLWLVMLFLLLLLPTWGLGTWVEPIGGEVVGVPVMSFLAVGAVIGMIVAALLLAVPGHGGPSPPTGADARAWGVLLLVMLILLAGAVFVGYLVAGGGPAAL